MDGPNTQACRHGKDEPWPGVQVRTGRTREQLPRGWLWGLLGFEASRPQDCFSAALNSGRGRWEACGRLGGHLSSRVWVNGPARRRPQPPLSGRQTIGISGVDVTGSTSAGGGRSWMATVGCDGWCVHLSRLDYSIVSRRAVHIEVPCTRGFSGGDWQGRDWVHRRRCRLPARSADRCARQAAGLPPRRVCSARQPHNVCAGRGILLQEQVTGPNAGKAPPVPQVGG